MAYHTPRFDKWLKNWSENSTEKMQKFEKTEFRDLVNLKLLLNRKELEKVIYMKNLRLDGIFPTTYHLLHSDKRFAKKRENMLAATRRAPTVFETALQLRGISKKFQHDEVAPNP